MIIRFVIFLLAFNFADYLGGYSGSGFRYSTNARDMSLGNTLISSANEGFNALSNPALLSEVKQLELGISYFPMSLDRSIQVFSISQKLSDSAGASVSFFNAGVSDIEGTDLYNESTGLFGANEGYMMLSFGSNLSEKIKFGLSVKAIFNNIDSYSAEGISGDLGFIYDFTDRTVFSIVVNNVFGKYSWDGLTSSSGSFEETLPTITSLGGRYKIQDNIQLFSKIDYMKPDQIDMLRLRTGLEFNQANYSLRVGLIQNQGLDNEDSFNFKFLLGAGTDIKFLGKHIMRLDYCIDFGKENEGISNLFSISFIK